MARIWEHNEEKDEDEELVVTEHRDEPTPVVAPEQEQTVEVPEGEDPQDALDALGEDVNSSPAQRAREGSDEALADDETGEE